MATTTNFGWETPDDTDLVKDGALAIRTLGSAIDTSLVDLKGGTTGQVLSKNSNTDMDFTWITNDQGDITGVTAGTGISGGGTSGTVTITNSMATAIDAKGDLVAGTGADAFSRLAVGTNGQYLSADSAETTGLKWVTPSSGALVKITSASFSNVATVNVDSCFTSTYRNYKVYLNVGASTEGDDLYILMRYGGTTETGLYYGSGFGYQRNNTSTTFGYSGNNQATISESTGGISGSDTYGFYELSFYNVGNGNRTAQCVSIGQAVLQSAPIAAFSTGDSRTYDGFQIKSSSTNITGNYAVYGLVN